MTTKEKMEICVKCEALIDGFCVMPRSNVCIRSEMRRKPWVNLPNCIRWLKAIANNISTEYINNSMNAGHIVGDVIEIEPEAFLEVQKLHASPALQKLKVMESSDRFRTRADCNGCRHNGLGPLGPTCSAPGCSIKRFTAYRMGHCPDRKE